jgi:dihydroxyacetone kinase phosphoprotein-dependent L subunit
MTGLRAGILAAADAVDAARDELGALDGIAGDGDHGMTMATAARNVRARLDAAPNAEGADLLRQVALGVGSVGGAIGPIYATAILRIAALPLSAPITVAQLLACAEAAEAGIVALGKARPGDKSVVDAIHPLVESLRASAAAGVAVAPALAAAAEAASAGAKATSDMIATVGRASRLGERSRGWADPGATSFSIIVRSLVATFVADFSAGR